MPPLCVNLGGTTKREKLVSVGRWKKLWNLDSHTDPLEADRSSVRTARVLYGLRSRDLRPYQGRD
jgi:hypothetical protein